jgi:hypothetical protein
MCQTSTAATVTASVMNCPEGDGRRINDCYAIGNTHYNATITLRLNDANGDSIPNYPGTDLWLETDPGGPSGSDMMHCPGGTVADGDTDEYGDAEWSQELFAGCWDNDGIVVVVNGQAVPAVITNVYVNSPDSYCDLIINLSDVPNFAADLAAYNAVPSVYNYRSDFYFDNQINLSDLVMLAQHYNHECP